VIDLFDGDLLELLRETCEGNRVRYETARNLLSIERRYRTMGNRRGLFKEIEKTVKNGCFETREEALEFKQREAAIKASRQIKEDGPPEEYSTQPPELKVSVMESGG
jgi:DNA sulfur modification protein DndC